MTPDPLESEVMAYPPATLPTNKTNQTAQLDDHPAMHNALAAAINDIVTELGGDPSNNVVKINQYIAGWWIQAWRTVVATDVTSRFYVNWPYGAFANNVVAVFCVDSYLAFFPIIYKVADMNVNYGGWQVHRLDDSLAQAGQYDVIMMAIGDRPAI